MARYLDFRHNANAAVGRVADNVAHLVLGVEEGAVVAIHDVEPHRRFSLCARLADGSDGGQFRVAVDLEAPAFAVREMPVEDVESLFVHEVKRPLDLIDSEEVAADVEHVAAPVVLRGGGGNLVHARLTA